MSILIIHDKFTGLGGAEKLVLSLLKINNSRLLTSYFDPKIFKIYPTNKKKIFSFKKYFSIVNLFYFCFKNKAKFFANKKVIIFSGPYSLFNFSINKNVKNIHYCHHLPKFIFEQNQYELKKRIILYLLSPILFFFKKLYLSNIRKMDYVISNSKFTQKKLSKFKIKSIIIYPPINVKKIKNTKKENFFLSFGRLEKYKNIELIINYFKTKSNLKLKVVSGGSMYYEMKKKTKNFTNIKLLSWQKQTKLNRLISKSLATIYLPKKEDFGMTAAESLAFGTPVISCNSGGLKEFLIHKKNSYLINEKNINNSSLDNAINFILKSKISKNIIKKNILKFSEDIFLKKMKTVLLKNK